MAYSGNPILAADLLFRPVHSLIDQSLHSRMGATTTNGDGFGMGWYGEGDSPAVYKNVSPAWNDSNLRELEISKFPKRVVEPIPLKGVPPATHTHRAAPHQLAG